MTHDTARRTKPAKKKRSSVYERWSFGNVKLIWTSQSFVLMCSSCARNFSLMRSKQSALLETSKTSLASLVNSTQLSLEHLRPRGHDPSPSSRFFDAASSGCQLQIRTQSRLQRETIRASMVYIKDGATRGSIISHPPSYRCYVVSLSNLKKYARLPIHEDALFAGDLDLLEPSSLVPTSAFTYFVSQNW